MSLNSSVTDEYQNRLARLLVSHPRWSMIIAILVCIASSLGVGKLQFSDDYRVYLGDNNPQLQAFEALEQVYSKHYNVLIVLAPKTGSVFSASVLAAVEQLTESSWQTPFSTRVDSLSNFQHMYADGDDIFVADLVPEAVGLTAEKLATIRDIALSEPMLVRRLVSPSADVTGINISLLPPDGDLDANQKVVAYVRELVAKTELAYPDIEFYLTGMALHDNAFLEASVMDSKTLLPAMYLFVIVITGFLFRSWMGMLATTLVIVAASLSAMGLAGWFNIVLSTPSANAPVIITTLAVANTIHLLATFLRRYREGLDRRAAAKATLTFNMRPILITSATTAIGFLSMNFSDSPPFQDLGNIVAMGVVAAWFYALFLLVPLCQMIPQKAAALPRSYRWFWVGFADRVLARPMAMVVVIALLIPTIAFGISRIELNDNFIEYFDDRFDFRVHTDFVRDRLTGLDTLEYSLDSGETGGLYAPGYLSAVEAFANWFRAQPEVVHVASVTDVMKRLNRSFHRDDPNYHVIPDQRELAAQYLLLYEMSLPQGLDTTDQINLDKSASRFTVSLSNVSNAQLLDVEQRASIWIDTHAGDHFVAAASGPSLMFAHIAWNNIVSMLSGTSLALVLISACLIFALRSLPLGLLSLVPNIVPALMAFGLWGYLSGEVGLAISVVSAMTLGMIVDDTVHFLHRYREAIVTDGHKAREAIQSTFVEVGPALFSTSLALSGGFLILSFSGFSVNGDMALLTAMTLGLALVADFLLLPPLLLLMDKLLCS
ncbi:MAG TPA: RND family transporter [Chromatiaceae bacterium]|nr:RND family transporter [Chromatiaceae bacterium]HIB83398.1 RND family transporter [Chromatiaceae bacterium]